MQNRNQKSLVAFIDILGFKEMVGEYYSNNNDTLLFNLKTALENAYNKKIKNSEDLNNTPYTFQTKQFSDCVTFSMSIVDKGAILIQVHVFLKLIGEYQRNLMEYGIFCRGGISFDYHIETDNFIFSHGLITAYNLENAIATYPRIIIDRNVFETFFEYNSPELKIITNKLLSPYIIEDWDGIYFVNPFDIFFHDNIRDANDNKNKIDFINNEKINQNLLIKKTLDFVNNNLEKHKKNYGKLRKYLWLKEFLNWHNDSNSSRIIFRKFEI